MSLALRTFNSSPLGRDLAPRAGTRNENPLGLSLPALWKEDLATHDGDWLSPGFLAVAVHRFGNWRMGIRPKPVRAVCTLLYRYLNRRVRIKYGIKLDYTVRLGRRVRIWHHGGMVLGARSIGDDVHVRQNTTIGVARRGAAPHEKPVIGNRVDIGAGACVVGPITLGEACVVAANSLVNRDVPPRSVVIGVPAHVVKTFAEPTREARDPSMAEITAAG
jgi:serine O-acetyltransferase